MKKDNSIILFHQKEVRRHWDVKKEFWYFSIIDVIEILTDSTIPKRYWSDLKSPSGFNSSPLALSFLL